MFNAFEITSIAPYFFIDPDWSSDVAQNMKSSVPLEKYRELCAQ